MSETAAYQALASRDARFDGRFVVGVTSTGIYCRPICRVKLPRAANCRFFAHAAAAESGGFRPCLRCRPELAPGLSLADSSDALALAGARLIEHAVAQGEAVALPEIARRLGVTDRHFRRIFQASHGVSPMAWLGTQRLLLAKRLLTDTALPVTEVAAASGFASLRRFHAAFAAHYRLSPGALRREAQADATTAARLRLSWRPPLDAEVLMGFLAGRPLAGVEVVQDGVWHRTLAVQHQGRRLAGWLSVRLDLERLQVQAEVSPGLAPALGLIAERVRHLLDLNADPALIEAGLARLAPHLPQGLRPGLRLPGCMDGFETTMRIILGQQVSVAAACTLAGRLVASLGEPVVTPVGGLTHLFPTAEAIAQASPDLLGSLGIVRARVRALQAVASAVAAGELSLDPSADMTQTLDRLQSLPGIGAWTCELVALRVFAWPDAFPGTDLGVRQALTGWSADAIASAAADWRPWRSYAVMQLWQALAEQRLSARVAATPTRPNPATAPSLASTDS